ncbi:eukaryotic mitochondrial regulator protein-domain-containing protein [Lipomyces kononenkoae]|uniref:Eukaryotic mitochondrial regulator protein-domain-containing protein n=1 Tax=Lipomyces kononenkoae TaxID=34357 RepID=A0ACC3T7H0_LIPKO
MPLSTRNVLSTTVHRLSPTQLSSHGSYMQVRGVRVGPGSYLSRDYGLVDGHTLPRSHMIQWFGEQSVNGDFNENPFCYAPWDHIPNYIPHSPSKTFRDETVKKMADSENRENVNENTYRPFPLNPFTKTSFLLSEELRDAILQTSKDPKMTLWQISSLFGIRKERVAATVKLAEIEKSWEEKGKITPDLARYAHRMYMMMPITNGRLSQTTLADRLGVEPMEEIVPPQTTQRNNIQIMHETANFSPKDAADILHAPEAAELMDRQLHSDIPTPLSFRGVKDEDLAKKIKEWKGPYTDVVFKGNNIWAAVPAKAGKVGYRYGASRDHRKKHRKHKDERLNI